MYNTIPDILRKQAIENLFATNTFSNCWETWLPKIKELLGDDFTASKIIDLGDNLSEIFKLTGNTGRGQGDLSGGGTAWESLVCWYMNLCTVGSRIVAIRKMSAVPKAIQNAITINYGNFSCNTESDITIIVFPNLTEYNTSIGDLPAIRSKNNIETNVLNKHSLNSKYIDILSEHHFSEYEIGIVQCKTNWNDNAQIPMLWNMVYSANFTGTNVTIGKGAFSIQHVRRFTYSFVTVPSNTRSKFTANNVSVKRVSNLSGGNYWGKETESDVARSIKEIFTNNFAKGYKSSIHKDISAAAPFFQAGDTFSYFRLHQ